MIIGSNLIFFDELTSTNTQASLMLREKEVPEGSVIYTDHQTAGRGQKGNRWESDKGKNLLFSVILYPGSVGPEDQFLISITISLGISDFVSRYFNEGCRIKWPNDIYLNNDKIAGILIENSLISDRIENSIAGIGININQEKFSSSLKNPASFKIVTQKEHDRQECFGQLLQELDKRYKQLLYGDREDLRKEYISRLYWWGEWHSFKTSCGVFTGMIEGVAGSGKIRIKTRENSYLEFGFKEISYEF
jgi:BirA family biotin operon repressor/biotin-[acetyl-CoA-carboxylase] ligase